MKIIVGMATFGNRHAFAQKAIESLENQVDAIHLYDNAQREDLTDNGKFWGLTLYAGEPVYYFCCDDDIIYPPTYIQDTIAAIEKHGCIITYHGRKLMGAGRNYYKGGHRFFHFAKDVPADEIIDIAGTGVTAFRTDYFNPLELYLSRHKRMSDLVMSLEAAVQKKKILVLAHKLGYFTQLRMPNNMTIFGMESNKCVTQGFIADQIFSINQRNASNFRKIKHIFSS